MTAPDNTGRELLREEFNRWAEAGRGEEMEEHHLPIVEPTLALMEVQAGDQLLDLGCGSGWLARRLAALAAGGRVVGVDVSDEMVRRAQQASAGVANVQFLQGSAEEIPVPPDTFTKAVSVESAYYWHDSARALAEIHRVLRAGGSAWILINYYRDNPYCHQWEEHFQIPTHLLSAAEWEQRCGAAGLRNIQLRRIPDRSPTPDVYTGRWFRDAEQMRRFKQEGALLISATKPL